MTENHLYNLNISKQIMILNNISVLFSQKIQTRALLCIFKPIPSRQSSLLSFSFYFQGQHVCCPGLVIFGLEGQHHTLWYFPSNDVKDWLVANWVYVKGLLLQFKMRLRNRTASRSINAFFRVALWLGSLL